MSDQHTQGDELEKLWPHLSDDERTEVRDNLEQYLKVCVRIYKHLEHEGRLEELRRKFGTHEDSPSPPEEEQGRLF